MVTVADAVLRSGRGARCGCDRVRCDVRSGRSALPPFTNQGMPRRWPAPWQGTCFQQGFSCPGDLTVIDKTSESEVGSYKVGKIDGVPESEVSS